MGEPRDRTWAVVVLLACSVVSLAFGGWITRDPEAGSGVVPRALFALLLLVTAVVISWGQRRARRTLGGLLVGLVLVLVVAGLFEDFRFVWPTGDWRLFATKVVLAVAGMGLLAPAYLAPGVASSADLTPEVAASPRPQLSEWGRLWLWLLTGAVLALLGHNLAGWSGVMTAVAVVVLAWVLVRLVRRRLATRA